jgi:hypothetical protein
VLGTTPPAGNVNVAQWTRATGYYNVNYFGFGNATRDVTSFPSVFNIPGYSIKPWPSFYNSPPVVKLRTNNYLALQFTVPKPYFSASNVPNPLYGNQQIGQSSWTVPVSMTIARACGDLGQLQPTTVVPGCRINMAGANAFFSWSNSPGQCNLKDGETYYLNVIEADISSYPYRSTAKAALCPQGACDTPFINGPGSWPRYTPIP